MGCENVGCRFFAEGVCKHPDSGAYLEALARLKKSKVDLIKAGHVITMMTLITESGGNVIYDREALSRLRETASDTRKIENLAAEVRAVQSGMPSGIETGNLYSGNKDQVLRSYSMRNEDKPRCAAKSSQDCDGYQAKRFNIATFVRGLVTRH